MDTTELMEELTTDQIEGDPDYALPIIRDYVAGGGRLDVGWILALLDEIDRLRDP